MPPPDTAAPCVAQALRDAAGRLSGLADGSPRLEAELLLSEATGWPRTTLIAWPERALSPAAADRLERLLQRRIAGEPIAYIRGRQSFWTLDLSVSPATLIPRPETELLVETALERLDAAHPLRVADLGTGSGAIAAAIASERPAWRVIATDRSTDALAVASRNFRDLRLARIGTLCCDWLDVFADAGLDAIVSNPPYIPDTDPHLKRGDLRLEPQAALASGRDGLDAIRAIASEAPRCLRPGGLVAVEHGFDQGPAVRGLFIEHGLRDVETRQDLAGLDRVTLARR